MKDLFANTRALSMKRFNIMCFGSLCVLWIVFIVGCSSGEQAPKSSEQQAQGATEEQPLAMDAPRAILDKFLVGMAGKYVPLYTSDGMYSGVSAYFDENARLITCNTHLNESLDSCLKNGEWDYVELGYVPHEAGMCVAGTNEAKAAVLGLQETKTICVYSVDAGLKPLPVADHFISDAHERGFTLPRGTPVLTIAHVSQNASPSRSHFTFEPEEYPEFDPDPAADRVREQPEEMVREENVSSNAALSSASCPSHDFHEFIREFHKPSIQREFTANQIAYTWLDSDFSEVSESRPKSDLKFPLFPYAGEGVSSLFVELPQQGGPASVQERGRENGINVTFGYEWKEGCWQLVSIEDYST